MEFSYEDIHRWIPILRSGKYPKDFNSRTFEFYIAAYITFINAEEEDTLVTFDECADLLEAVYLLKVLED